MIDLTQVRIELDGMTKELINGIKARSNYSLDQRLITSELEKNIETIASSTEALKETPILTSIEFYKRINEMYLKGLSRQISQDRAVPNNPEALKIDITNVTLLTNRIAKGQMVARAKYEQTPQILTLPEAHMIKELRSQKRESEVINNAVSYAQQVGLNYPLEIRYLFREIIEITLDVEIDYLRQIK